MQTLTLIKHYQHNDHEIRCAATQDAAYAHDCFDGNSLEWEQVLNDAWASANPMYLESQVTDYAHNPRTFYLVSCGLSGSYMADDVSVFGAREDALQYAKDTFARWQDEDSDLETV